MTLVRMPRNLDCGAVGPAATVARAIALIDETPIDAALLDINLEDGTSEAVAKILDAKEVPYIFITACAEVDMIDESLARKPLLLKPVNVKMLNGAIEAFLDSRGKP